LGGHLSSANFAFELDGRIYKKAHGRLTSTPADSSYLPDHGSHNGGFERDRTDPLYRKERANDYAYARTNPDDFGAEMYSKAVNAPELVYKDFVADPQKRVDSLDFETQELEQRLCAARADGASAEVIEKLENDLEGTKGALAEAERIRSTRADEIKALREDVFHLTPDVVTDARTRLGTARNPEQAKLLAEYDRRAAEAMTPEQLEKLTKEYEGKIK